MWFSAARKIVFAFFLTRIRSTSSSCAFKVLQKVAGCSAMFSLHGLTRTTHVCPVYQASCLHGNTISESSLTAFFYPLTISFGKLCCSQWASCLQGRVETDAEIGFYPPFFVCDNNWTIPFLYVDDAWCDCPACEDEFDFDCTTCGGCPTVCGEFVDCLVARAQQVFGGECRVGLALYYLELSHYLPFDDLLGTEFRTCSIWIQKPSETINFAFFYF